MLRFLPALIELALLIYCLVDCIQTDESRVRNLPKVGWILIIIILPIVGGIAWLLAGRPKGPADRGSVFGPAAGRPGAAGTGRRGPARPVAPEDDPDFMRGLGHGDPEKERLLEQWEADLKRREEQLRPPPVTPPDDGGPAPGLGPDAQDRPVDPPA